MDDRVCNVGEGTGYEPVDTTVSCVLTRFRLRSVWSLFRFYRSFRRVRADVRGASGGLLAAVFLVEDLRTCYTLSLWRDARAILEFNSTSNAHVVAANRCFHDVEIKSARPQIWSAQFQLSAVSPHNLRWEGVNVLGHRGNPVREPRSRSSRRAPASHEVNSDAS